MRIELLLQFLLQRDIVPAQIGRENDFARFRIHRARRADANGTDLLEIEIALVHRLADAARDATDHFVGAAVGFGADAGAADAIEFPVKNAGQDFRAAKIDADDVLVFLGVVGHSRFYFPPRRFSTRSCNSALISSTERSPLTMVKP